MRPMPGLAALLAPLAAVAVASIANATLVPRMDPQELAAQADAIAIATVVGVRFPASAPGLGPSTRVDLRVEVPLKRAHPGEIISLVLPGGPTPQSRGFVPGTPHFALGEVALVHVHRTPSGHREVLGGVQGRASIRNGLTVRDCRPLGDAIRVIERTCGSAPSSGRLARLSGRAPTAGPAPVIAGIAPAKVSANTRSEVTITGANFGAGTATADRVAFSRHDYPGQHSYGWVVEWTNTRIKCQVPVADSGSVVVETRLGGPSNPVPLDISFCDDRCSVRPLLFPQARYYNEAGTPDAQGEFAALTRAFQTWERVPDCYVHSFFGGFTKLLPAQGYSQNTLGWYEEGWPFPNPPQATAVAVTRRDGRSERDIAFNGTGGRHWSDGKTGSGYDVENVAAHEIGHWWGLGDLYGDRDLLKTMSGFGLPGEHWKRSLDPDDISGLQYLYPGKPAFRVSPESLTFTREAGSGSHGNLPYQEIKVANGARGVLSWVVSRQDTWVLAYTDREGGNEQRGSKVQATVCNVGKTVLGSPYKSAVVLKGPLGCGGSPCMIPVTFKVTGEAPRAQWLRGEDDGVEPDLGGPNRDVFTFRAVYHDPDWWRPKVAECLVYRFSVEEGLKLFRRLPLGSVPGEGNGQVLGASTTLPLGVYRYRFRFESSDGHDVGGEPTATQRGPVVVGPPRLYWAGQPGFEKNGVDPDRGAPGTTFSFRVLYQDSDGQRPSEAWLVIRRDGKTQGKKGMASHGGSYYRGTAYRTTLRLSTPGDYEYAFRFADDSGPAVGEPTHWQPGPRVGSAPRRALAVTSLAAVPVGGGVQLRFALSVAADVTAQVLNGAGRPVRRVCTGRPCEAGATALPWDGRDDAGLRVPGGTYLLTLTAIARDGQCTRAVGAVRLDR